MLGTDGETGVAEITIELGRALKHMRMLPEVCGARHPVTGEALTIRLGQRGYYPAEPGFDPDKFNALAGVTPAQRDAMLCASMFGWDVPGATPAAYEATAKENA